MQYLQIAGKNIFAGIINFLRLGMILLALASMSAQAQASEPDAKRQQELQQLLHQNCAACHGHTLEGGIGPALTAETLSGKDKQALVTTILQGRPGTAMPAWDWMFKKEEARWLVTFLHNGGG